LKFASENLQTNQEIVLEAVKQNGRVLQEAPEQLRGDKAIALAAVGQNGVALKYVENNLWADKDVVCAALRNNRTAIKYASAHLFRDPVHPEIATVLGIDVHIFCKIASCTSRRPGPGDRVLSIRESSYQAENQWTLHKGETATVIRVDDKGEFFQLSCPRGRVSNFLRCKAFAYALTCPRRHVMTRRVKAAEVPYVCCSCNEEQEDVQICDSCNHCLCRTCAPWDVNLDAGLADDLQQADKAQNGGQDSKRASSKTACCAVM